MIFYSEIEVWDDCLVGYVNYTIPTWKEHPTLISSMIKISAKLFYSENMEKK